MINFIWKGTVALIISSSVVFAEEMCAYERNAINPSVAVNVESQKDGSYKYTYAVTNQSNSKIPVAWFFVETSKLHENVKMPINWKLLDWADIDAELLKWASKQYEVGEIKIGTTMNGFEFTSKFGPGLVKYVSEGENSPKVYSNTSDKAVLSLCPGMYQAGSSVPGFSSIEGLTIGPIPSSRKSAELRIKRSEGKSIWTGEYRSLNNDLLSFSPLEKGKIEVALLDSESLGAEDVDVSTVEFGKGKAKPIKAVISDCDISPSKKTKALVMTFNLEDINVLCNIDHALFLNGKTKNGVNIFGGVKIRTTECTQENWQKEADRMIKSNQLELPEGKYKIK